jgi:hypothetical protein
MRVWMVRYLSREEVEFYRLFQEREDALSFLQSPGEGCFPLDQEPKSVSPEEFLAYTLYLMTSLF